jgi:hypothetical protein
MRAGASVEVHAVGHSAARSSTAISLNGDQARWLVQTMRFLAGDPHRRSGSCSRPMLARIERLTLFTMTEDYEKKDNCRRKSAPLSHLLTPWNRAPAAHADPRPTNHCATTRNSSHFQLLPKQPASARRHCMVGLRSNRAGPSCKPMHHTWRFQ